MKVIKSIRSFGQENKGVTLVELLVVIAILGLTIGITGLSITLVYSRDPEKCAKAIAESLEEARRSAMTMKGTFILKIDTQTGRVEILSSERGSMEMKKLPERVSILLETTGGSVDISTDTSLEVEFDKGTGRVKSVKTASGVVDGTMLSIHCDNDTRRVTVVLVRATGKHYLEYKGK